MFLYPLAITLVLLALFAKAFGNHRSVYVWTTAFTLVAAIFDMIGAISGMVPGNALLRGLTGFAGKVLPLYSLGLGWVCPALLGFIAGLAVSRKEG